MSASLGLRKATRQKAKVRIGLSGPSGSGKTYSALLIASGMVPWDKIAVIDTENGSADLYSHLGAYSVITLQAPFSPERYIQAIDECVKAGMEVIIIDSVTPEWDGAGGCLESNDLLGQTKFKGNNWAAWSMTTPRHQKFIQAITASPCHMITTARAKTDTIQTEDKKIKKVGLKEIQREGFEYELTVNFTLDREGHFAVASKDRTEMFSELDPFKITEETGKMLAAWASSGVEPLPPPPPAENPSRVGAGMPDSSVSLDHKTMTLSQFLEIINDRKIPEKSLLTTYTLVKTRDDFSMEDRGILSGNFLRNLCDRRRVLVKDDWSALIFPNGNMAASLTWDDGWVTLGKAPPPAQPQALPSSPPPSGVIVGGSKANTSQTTPAQPQNGAGTTEGTANAPVLTHADKIARIERDIAYEREQYDIGEKHPTDTDQFRNAQVKQLDRIRAMEGELAVLKGQPAPSSREMSADQWIRMEKAAKDAGKSPAQLDEYAKVYYGVDRASMLHAQSAEELIHALESEAVGGATVDTAAEALAVFPNDKKERMIEPLQLSNIQSLEKALIEKLKISPESACMVRNDILIRLFPDQFAGKDIALDALSWEHAEALIKSIIETYRLEGVLPQA